MIIGKETTTICSYSGNDILNPPVVIQVGIPAYFSRVLEIQNRETHHNLRRQSQGGNGDEDEEDDDEGDEDANDDDEADEDDEDNDDDK
uniref:Uncharacterized protein n=1 Tax=Lactuca sativa TaxID=4236 RepID=A0A9R1XTS1_LACSA|nr:hypothetical protein LSAT_V11C100035730 [Lactuca sativa]